MKGQKKCELINMRAKQPCEVCSCRSNVKSCCSDNIKGDFFSCPFIFHAAIKHDYLQKCVHSCMCMSVFHVLSGFSLWAFWSIIDQRLNIKMRSNKQHRYVPNIREGRGQVSVWGELTVSRACTSSLALTLNLARMSFALLHGYISWQLGCSCQFIWNHISALLSSSFGSCCHEFTRSLNIPLISCSALHHIVSADLSAAKSLVLPHVKGALLDSHLTEVTEVHQRNCHFHQTSSSETSHFWHAVLSCSKFPSNASPDSEADTPACAGELWNFYLFLVNSFYYITSSPPNIPGCISGYPRGWIGISLPVWSFSSDQEIQILPHKVLPALSSLSLKPVLGEHCP